MQKERFTDEFSSLLTKFQTVQREAVEKMRASVQRARAHSGINQVHKQGHHVSELVVIFLFIPQKISVSFCTSPEICESHISLQAAIKQEMCVCVCVCVCTCVCV